MLASSTAHRCAIASPLQGGRTLTRADEIARAARTVAAALGDDDPHTHDPMQQRITELEAKVSSLSSTLLAHTGKLDAHDTRLHNHDDAIEAQITRNDQQDVRLERHRRRIRWLERLHHWAGFWRPNPAP